MNRLRRSQGLTSLRVVRRAVAAVAVGAVGRALWYAAVDALVIYVFGDPAPQRRERSTTARSATRRDDQRLVA